MLARHAENLFWAGRYLERAEDTARILDATHHSTLVRPGAVAQWRDLLSVLRLRSAFDAGDRSVGRREVSAFLVTDEANPGSIVASVRAVRENFRTVRDQLPSEVWESANRFHLHLSTRDIDADLDGEPYLLFEAVRTRAQTVAGVIEQTMPRDDGYRFLVVGMLLERALMTSRLVEVRWPLLAAGSFDEIVLTLSSVSALEPFRRVYHSSTDGLAVAAYLLQHELFPRSVLYSLQRAEATLGRLTGSGPIRNRTQILLGRLRSSLEFADLADPATTIPSICDELEDGIRHVAESMGPQYFRSADEAALHAQYLLPGEMTPR